MSRCSSFCCPVNHNVPKAMTPGMAKVPTSCRYSHPLFFPNSAHLHTRAHHGGRLLEPFPCSGAAVPSSVVSLPSVICTTITGGNERMMNARFHPLCYIFMRHHNM